MSECHQGTPVKGSKPVPPQKCPAGKQCVFEDGASLKFGVGTCKPRPKAESVKRSDVLGCNGRSEALIRQGYGRGRMKLTRLAGPFRWKEAFFDSKGNPGLRHRIAYTVAIKWKGAHKKRRMPGMTLLLLGDCQDGDPSRLVVRNRDGVRTLADFYTVTVNRRR